MIATLSGTISENLADTVVLEVNGVGYGVFVSVEDFGWLKPGQQTKLYIYEYIREQAHDLFGFIKLDTKRLFEQLLNVSGIGPRMALSVLSIGTANEVRQAIAGGDTKFIQAAPGVGKRVAERLVVELKDKVGLIGTDLASAGLLQSETEATKDEAAQALIALGFSIQDATTALAKVDSKLPTEDRVKLALKEQK